MGTGLVAITTPLSPIASRVSHRSNRPDYTARWRFCKAKLPDSSRGRGLFTPSFEGHRPGVRNPAFNRATLPQQIFSPRSALDLSGRMNLDAFYDQQPFPKHETETASRPV